MTAFVEIALSFPTALFSTLLVVVGAYWALVLLGALDMDGDGLMGLDHADGVADAAAHALGHGAGEGLAHGLADGLGDAVDGLHHHHEADLSGAAPASVASLLALLRFGKVPITVALSLFALSAWVASFLLAFASRELMPGLLPVWALAFANLGVAPLVAMVVSPVMARPFEPLFRTHQGRSQQTLIGESGVITTGRVDDRFGQAEVVMGSDHLLVQVRCDHRTLRRDDRVLLVRHDPGRDAFLVEPLDVPAVVRRPGVDPAGPL